MTEHALNASAKYVSELVEVYYNRYFNWKMRIVTDWMKVSVDTIMTFSQF
jgi:hypothetical protein